MEQNKEDKLKKLIQSIEPDEPRADLAVAIMQNIEASESIVLNPALDSLLEKHLLEVPSADFTQELMMAIERADKKVVYKPIIPTKAWYSIGVAATIIISLVILFGKSPQVNTQTSPLANSINQITGQLINQINTLPTILLTCLFAVSALLILDYFISRRKNYHV